MVVKGERRRRTRAQGSPEESCCAAARHLADRLKPEHTSRPRFLLAVALPRGFLIVAIILRPNRLKDSN